MKAALPELLQQVGDRSRTRMFSSQTLFIASVPSERGLSNLVSVAFGSYKLCLYPDPCLPPFSFQEGDGSTQKK